MVKIGTLVFFISVYLHLVACIWFYINNNNDKTWVPPYDFHVGTTELFEDKWIR